MGFFDSWLERTIRERMPATLGSEHFIDTLGELGPAYTADRDRPMRDPVEGWMHVVGCTAGDPDATRAPCRITYVIQAEGVGLFSGDQTFELNNDQWPKPCDDLPVVFDRAHIDHIRIQWDRLPTHAECVMHQINSRPIRPSRT